MQITAGKISAHNITVFAMVGIAFLWLLLIYYDITHHEFLHWDDIIYFVDNPHLQNFTLANIGWMITDSSMMNWHPLTWLSHSIEFAVFGKNPFAAKIINIILHIGNCIVLYFLFRTLLDLVFTEQHSDQFNRNFYTAMFASSVYAIHPQHIESVAWIAERKDILCGLFYFSTLLSYLKYHQLHNRHYLSATFIFAALATMSKPMAVTLPLVLILFDIYPLKLISTQNSLRENVRIIFNEKAVIFALSIFIAAITLFTQSLTIKSLSDIGVITRIINACIASLHYLGTIVLPTNLSPFYPFSDTALSPDFFSLFPAVVMVILCLLCATLWKKGHPLYLMAMLFFIISILPVIGIVTVGDQAYADRYTYITTGLFYLAISHTITGIYYRPAFTDKSRLIGIGVTAVIVLSLLGMVGIKQIKNWRNDESLWLSVNKLYPNKVPKSYQILGNTYLVQGRYQEAVDNYNIAVNLQPEFSKVYENLGRAYSKLGLKDKELENYLLAIKYDSNAMWARFFAGNIYLNMNEIEKAEKLIRQTLVVDPRSQLAITENAKLDLVLKQPMRAKTRLRDFLRLYPDNVEAIWMLTQIFYAEGNIAQSRLLLNEVLRLSPNNSPAMRLMAELDKLKNR